MAKMTGDDLAAIKKSAAERQPNCIKVGMSTCGIAAGADKVYAVIEEELKKLGSTIDLKKCGCLGMCYAEPLVEVQVEGLPRVIYCRVKEPVARDIVRGHVAGKKILQDHIVDMQHKELR